MTPQRQNATGTRRVRVSPERPARDNFLEQDFLRLEGFTRDDRHAMISRVREAFNASSASIVDFKMFSNVSLSIIFELPARRLIELSNALAATGLRLSDDSRELMAQRQQRYAEGEAEPPQQDEFKGALQITFIHHEPDLRLDVPAIPG